MNSPATSDTSLTSCAHCAAPLRDRAGPCPRCGEEPAIDGGFDATSWFDPAHAPESAANDHVLEAMMAIAAAEPKAMKTPTPPALPPSLPALVGPSFDTQPLQQQVDGFGGADSVIATSTVRWRVLAGVLALAALGALLLNASGIWRTPRTAPGAGTVPASVTLSAPRAVVQSDGEGPNDRAAAAGPALAAPPAPQTAAPDRTEAEDARTIASALGLGERPEAPIPTTAPAAAPVPGPGDAGPCGEAMAALALCRRP